MVLQTRAVLASGTNIVDWEAKDATVFAKLISAAVEISGLDALNVWTVSMREPFKAVLDQHGFGLSRHRMSEDHERGLLAKEADTGSAFEGTRVSINELESGSDFNMRMIFSDDY